MFCQNCGNRLENDVRFCPNCGKTRHSSAAAGNAADGYADTGRNNGSAGTGNNYFVYEDRSGEWKKAGRVVLVIFIMILAAAAAVGGVFGYRKLQEEREKKRQEEERKAASLQAMDGVVDTVVAYRNSWVKSANLLSGTEPVNKIAFYEYKGQLYFFAGHIEELKNNMGYCSFERCFKVTSDGFFVRSDVDVMAIAASYAVDAYVEHMDNDQLRELVKKAYKKYYDL